MFERAKKAGFLLKSFRDPEIDWFDWCSRNNWPCLVIRTRRKYADLWLDLITTDHDFSRQAARLIFRFLNVLPHTGLRVGPLTVHMKNLPIKYAEQIGRLVLDVIELDRKLNPLTLVRPIKKIEAKG